MRAYDIFEDGNDGPGGRIDRMAIVRINQFGAGIEVDAVGKTVKSVGEVVTQGDAARVHRQSVEVKACIFAVGCEQLGGVGSPLNGVKQVAGAGEPWSAGGPGSCVVKDDDSPIRRRTAAAGFGERNRCGVVQAGSYLEIQCDERIAYVRRQTRQDKSLHGTRAIEPRIEELAIVGDGQRVGIIAADKLRI